MALNLVTLTGSYQNGSNLPCAGNLKFVPTAPLTDATDDEVIRQVPLAADLSEGGTFSISLLATDNTDLSPSGWCWTVTECITGLAPAQWAFFLAHAVGATQDISTLEPVVVAPVTGEYLPLAGGTLTGPLTLAGNPGGALQAAPKQYVDAETTRAEGVEATLSTEIAGRLSLLTQTSVKTANYTAAAGQLVPVNTSGGAVTITLPAAPAAGTVAGIKQVATIGSSTTVACGGSDVFNKPASGVTSLTLPLLNQGVLLEYNSGVWIVLADDLPLTALDSRYVLTSQVGADSGVASLNSSGYVPVTEGGTGAGTAPAALTALGAVPASEVGAASGVAGLNSSGYVPLAQGGTGNATGQPSGTAGGVLAGTYPSPSGLAATGVTPGSYTLADIQVGADGRITAATDGSAMGSMPLTTLGDTLYENSFPAAARLPGNTSTTKNFLTQTGTGSASAAPAWGTIQAADVPTLNQNTTGSAATATTAAGLSSTLAIGSGGTGAASVGSWPTLNQNTTGTAAGLSSTLAIGSGGTGAVSAPAALTALGAAALTGATFTGWLAPAVVTLTFGSSITVNAAAGNDFRLTLTASTGTIANPSNPVDGQMIEFAIAQDSTGGRTVSWGSAYDFGAAGAPALSATASKVDLAGFKYHAGLGKWLCLGSAFGY